MGSAHGTADHLEKGRRKCTLTQRVQGNFVVPHLLHDGGPFSIDEVLKRLDRRGGHEALGDPEGALWRVER